MKFQIAPKWFVSFLENDSVFLKIGIALAVGQGRRKSDTMTLASVQLNCRQPEGFSRCFLFHHCPNHRDDPHSISYYQAFAASDTPLETLVGVAC